MLISALTTSSLNDVQNNPAVPKDLASPAPVELAGGIPLMSDKDLQAALDEANVPPETADAIVDRQGERKRPHRRTARLIVTVRRHWTDRTNLQRPDPTKQPSVAAAREHPP